MGRYAYIVCRGEYGEGKGVIGVCRSARAALKMARQESTSFGEWEIDPAPPIRDSCVDCKVLYYAVSGCDVVQVERWRIV